MKNNQMYVKSPEGRHIPKVTIGGLLERFHLLEFWNFADEFCDEKEFEKIAQLIIFYMAKKAEANG